MPRIPAAVPFLQHEDFIHKGVAGNGIGKIVPHKYTNVSFGKTVPECTEHRGGEQEIPQHIVLADHQDTPHRGEIDVLRGQDGLMNHRFERVYQNVLNDRHNVFLQVNAGYPGRMAAEIVSQ